MTQSGSANYKQPSCAMGGKLCVNIRRAYHTREVTSGGGDGLRHKVPPDWVLTSLTLPHQMALTLDSWQWPGTLRETRKDIHSLCNTAIAELRAKSFLFLHTVHYIFADHLPDIIKMQIISRTVGANHFIIITYYHAVAPGSMKKKSKVRLYLLSKAVLGKSGTFTRNKKDEGVLDCMCTAKRLIIFLGEQTPL